MRNKFAGKCYVCGKNVEAGQGYFQRDKGAWLVKHKGCKTVREVPTQKGVSGGYIQEVGTDDCR